MNSNAEIGSHAAPDLAEIELEAIGNDSAGGP